MKDHVSNDCGPNNHALNTKHQNVIKPKYNFHLTKFLALQFNLKLKRVVQLTKITQKGEGHNKQLWKVVQ